MKKIQSYFVFVLLLFSISQNVFAAKWRFDVRSVALTAALTLPGLSMGCRASLDLSDVRSYPDISQEKIKPASSGIGTLRTREWDQPNSGFGQAFLVAPNLILTAAHVVSGSGMSIENVIYDTHLKNGHLAQIEIERVVLVDAEHDIALLQLKESVDPTVFRPIELSRTALQDSGQIVYIVPNRHHYPDSVLEDPQLHRTVQEIYATTETICGIKAVTNGTGMVATNNEDGTTNVGLHMVSVLLHEPGDIYQGDSGALVMNLDGKAVGVVSAMGVNRFTGTKVGYYITPIPDGIRATIQAELARLAAARATADAEAAAAAAAAPAPVPR